jgi:hypothetical protein
MEYHGTENRLLLLFPTIKNDVRYMSKMDLVQIVKERGPITAYSIGRLTGMKRSKVNAILHADRHFVKTERSPLGHVTARPIWSWSETKVPLPPARRHINSRNKTIRRKANAEYEKSLVRE